MADPTPTSTDRRNQDGMPPLRVETNPAMSVYDDRFDPDSLDDIEPSDTITFTWKGTGSSAVIDTVTEAGVPWGLFDDGTGKHSNEYTITTSGTDLKVKSDAPDGKYDVNLQGASGVKATINVKKTTEDDEPRIQQKR